MKLKKGYWFGIIAGVIVILASFLFITVFDDRNLFYFVLGSGFLIAFFPFVVISIIENRVEQEKDEMFLEFSRSLVESVESGTPISKGIINMKSKNFGSLSPHVEKLSNQIELGIPLQQALEVFAYDTKSPTIMRAVTLIREADKTGGNIDTILESVAKSVSETEKLKAERRSAISSSVVEGYIIFFVFILIMIIMELQIIPLTSNLSGLSGTTLLPVEGSSLGTTSADSFSYAFLFLLITQGIFAGLIIGRLAEGSIKAGVKHSFILTAMAILMSTGSKVFL